jgi:hypothetical protein
MIQIKVVFVPQFVIELETTNCIPKPKAYVLSFNLPDLTPCAFHDFVFS